jgi:hypothetical protein
MGAASLPGGWGSHLSAGLGRTITGRGDARLSSIWFTDLLITLLSYGQSAGAPSEGGPEGGEPAVVVVQAFSELWHVPCACPEVKRKVAISLMEMLREESPWEEARSLLTFATQAIVGEAPAEEEDKEEEVVMSPSEEEGAVRPPPFILPTTPGRLRPYLLTLLCELISRLAVASARDARRSEEATGMMQSLASCPLCLRYLVAPGSLEQVIEALSDHDDLLVDALLYCLVGYATLSGPPAPADGHLPEAVARLLPVMEPLRAFNAFLVRIDYDEQVG